MKSYLFIYCCILFFLCIGFSGCNDKKIGNVDTEPVYEGPIGEGLFQLKNSVSPVLEEASVEQPYIVTRIGLIPPASPDSYLRIRFSDDIGNNGKSGNLTNLTEISINLSPAIKGKYEWKSAKELWIKIDKKKWVENQEYSINISGSSLNYDGYFTVGTFSLGSKTGIREVTLGNPSAVMILNGNSGLTDKNGAYILFDQPVNVSKIYVKCEKQNGKVISVSVTQPDELPVEGGDVIDPTYVVYAKFNQALNPNEMITIFAGNSSQDFNSFEVQVAPELTYFSNELDSLSENGTARLRTKFSITFSTPVSIDTFRKFLNISPQPRGLYTYQEENTFYMETVFDVATDYSVSIKDEGVFTDILGQSLTEKKEYKFRSQDLDPYLQLPDKQLVLEAGLDRFPVKIRNAGKARIEIKSFRSNIDYIRSLKGEKPENFTTTKVIETDLSTLPMNDLHTVDLGIDNKPGLKFITVTINGTGSEAVQPLSGSLLVQTTAIGLSAKIWEGKVLGWAIDIEKGKPLGDVKISAVSNRGEILASGKSGNDGVAVLDVGDFATLDGVAEEFFLVANKNNDSSITLLNDADLSQAWQFNLPGILKDMKALDAAFFTERGAYRPGETVYFKIYARPFKDILASKMNFIIRDPLGQTVFRSSENPDGYYGASGSFNIKEGAAVGEYIIEAMLGNTATKTSFRVEEYRVPTFSVKLSSTNKDYFIGNVVSIDAKSAYLHGGLMDGRDLTWKVYRQPDTFAPKNFPGYVFGLAIDSSLTGTIASGTGVLNKQSEFKLSYTPDHPSSAGLMKYIAEVAVTDVDRQTYAGRFSKSIHSSGLYVGLKPQARAIYPEGSVLKLPFIVVDTEGNIVTGKKVEVQLNRIEYHTTTMENDEGSSQVYNREVTETKNLGYENSPKAPSELSIPLESAGSFQVRLNVTDDKGKIASTEFLLTVSGGESSSWPRFDRERMELVTDKGDYKVGDTAKIVAQTPYESATGLLTIEANGVIEHRIVEINKDTPAFEIPINSEYAPNVYASLVLIRGRVHKLKDATGFETGAPGYKIGYAKLNIDPGEKRLIINIDSGSGSVSVKELSASPGDNVTLNISVKDKSGIASDASATVMVVDEGVLSLTAYKTPDPISMAYKLRSLGIRNTSNILDMPHSKRIRKESLFPGGDSDEPGQLNDDSDVLRKLFKSTVYWNPSLILGADGIEKITFKLPDNLTTFRVMVVAADKNGKMGSGEMALVSRKTLMVQPITPRFVYPEDVFNLEAQVINGSGKEENVQFFAEFTGLEILEKPKLEALIPAGKSRNFIYKVKVKENVVKYKFKASMGNFKDGVEITLPVLSPGNKTTLVKTLLLKENEFVNIDLPKDMIPGTLKIEAVLSGTPLSQLKDSVQYLMEYPNGCIEQTTSTAYPLIVLQDLLPSIGIDVNRADLKKFSEAGVKRILSFQTSQGGLSYWPDGQVPHAFATAFGLTVLIEGKKRGYDVPSESLERMADYLEKSLREGNISGEMPHGGMADADTRALFVMTLGRLGRPQPGYIEALWNNKKELTPFGLSFLALAIKESKTNSTLLEPVLAEIKTAAQVKDAEAYYDGTSKGGWSFDSPIRTHAGALVAYSEASPNTEITPKLLQGLLNRSNNGMWGNTQENVFGIMGIYQLVGSKTTNEKLKAGIEINGKMYSYKDMEANSSQILRITLPGSIIGNDKNIKAKFTGVKDGAYYLTLRAGFDEVLGDKHKKPKSEGYTIKRIYETIDGRSLEGQNIPLGSLVRVRLIVKATATQHYVAIDDKLPAGLEALNMSLETTQSVDQEKKLSPEALRTIPLISYHEIRDHRVAFYADEMLEGDYEFNYIAKASTPGNFLRPAGRAEAMYQTDFCGTTGIDRITVK